MPHLANRGPKAHSFGVSFQKVILFIHPFLLFAGNLISIKHRAAESPFLHISLFNFFHENSSVIGNRRKKQYEWLINCFIFCLFGVICFCGGEKNKG